MRDERTPDDAAARLAGLDIPAALTATMQRIILTAERGITARTLVRTGRLRRSVHGQVRSATEGVIGTNVIYARPVHRRVPFMTLGMEDVEDDIAAILETGGAELWAQVTR